MNNREGDGATESFFTECGVTIHLIMENICHLPVDAIVTPAVKELTSGGVVDRIIHRAAGPQLLMACLRIPMNSAGERCPKGKAVLTEGPFADDLYALNVIHTVGPKVVRDSNIDEQVDILRSCITSCMNIALEKEYQKLAFTAISCGIHNEIGDRWVKAAAKCNLNTVMSILESRHRARLDTSLTDVLFVFADFELFNAFKVAAHERIH